VGIRDNDTRNIYVGPPQSGVIEKDTALGKDDLFDHPSEGDVGK
jgi:hypothetical protein